jgi:putative DNA primase/helicase
MKRSLSPQAIATRDAAFAAYAAGLSVLPPRGPTAPPPHRKAPIGTTWKQYQCKRATEYQLRNWYGNGERTWFGTVCGAISRNLEGFDFDERQAYAEFLAKASACGLGPLVTRIEAGYCEDTPNGVHWLYRCEAVAGSQELARRYKHPDEFTEKECQEEKEARERGKEFKPIQVKIETRGEGGYIVLAPTVGLHDNGAAYVLRCGGFDSIVTITPEEREQLFGLARDLDEIGDRITYNPHEHSSPSGDEFLPGTDFNERASWAEILEPSGWKNTGHHGGLDYWLRPGKEGRVGCSATTGVRPEGANLLHVFTSSTAFAQSGNYTKFAAYAVIEHNGDFKAAAKALREEGYGNPKQASTRTPRETAPNGVADAPAVVAEPDIDPERFVAEPWPDPPDVAVYTAVTMLPNCAPRGGINKRAG